MGYYTRYSLTTKLLKPLNDPLHSVLGEPQPNFVAWLTAHSPDDLDGFDPFEEPCKWYEHERDMKSLSETFPAYVFILRGQGEDTSREGNDLWVKHFFQGRMHAVRAKIVFDPPPPSFCI